MPEKNGEFSGNPAVKYRKIGPCAMGARGAVPRCFVMRQKRIAAIHDISGFGKCSLTVVLPILSAAGIETSVMPTAVLSTHTGGLGKCTYRDLTEDMRDYAAHWKSLNLSFDALYTGFLGSAEQIGIVSDIVDSKYLVTAIALVQTVRSLGSIFIQHFAGAVIDAAGYEMMSFFLAGLMVLVIVLAWFLKVPEKEGQKLFS